MDSIGVVDLRLVPLQQSSKAVILGRVTLDEDGKQIDTEELSGKICSFAMAQAGLDGDRCNEVIKAVRRVTHSGERSLDEVDRVKWDDSETWGVSTNYRI